MNSARSASSRPSPRGTRPTRAAAFVPPALRALLLAAATVATAAAAAPRPSEDPALVERGRYLVSGVGLCADCHTPRDAQGRFQTSFWLMGSALGIQPKAEMPWSPVAPPIAGLPSMTREEAVTFLMQGTRPDGSRPRPPMPEYRLNAEDARAVVAYLKSLAAPAPPVMAVR